MDRLIISHSKLLSNSSIKVSGSKNGFLPILIASILCSDTVTLKNAPYNLKDTSSIIDILNFLNVKLNYQSYELNIASSNISNNKIPYEATSKTRYSILFLGALSGLYDDYHLPLPGGCNLGSTRPIDIHIEGLIHLGAKVYLDKGHIVFSKTNKLKGSHIIFRIPSVTATENIMLAATLADGVTTLENAAIEPEVIDLCNFLNGCGADISRVGRRKFIIKGVKNLRGTKHCIIPDRVEIGTFIALAAITKIKLEIYPVVIEHLDSVLEAFIKMGIKLDRKGNKLLVDATGELNPIKIESSEYPGFPTDMLPIISAACVKTKGESILIDKVFPKRLSHLQEFIKLGAKVITENDIVKIIGVDKLIGTKLYIHNIRAGAAIAMLALSSEGSSEIYNVSQIDRGYENFWKKLMSIGARIEI